MSQPSLETMPTNHQETSTLPIEPLSYERHNEEAFDVLRVLAQLWRWRYFVAAFSAVGTVVAGLVAISMDNRYTAEVVVQARLPRQDAQQQSNIFFDAASVIQTIQTDASLIRSREIAEGVVARLGLAENPNFAEHSSLLNRAFALITFWHSRSSLPVADRLQENVAERLQENLDVTNDPKSLSIRISYTSTSPEQSARIVNAFAQEYLRVREEKAAQQQLAGLAVLYGPKHPNVLKAQSRLDAWRALGVVDSSQILAGAFPPAASSGPPRRRIVAVAFICSLLSGIVLVLILEGANTSFRSDTELATEVKAPCLGMFAEGSAGPGLETARAIAMAAGIRAQSPQSKILLITSSVPKEGECLVSAAIAHSLVQMGGRAVLLDLSREAPKSSNLLTLENVLDGLENQALRLDKQLTVLQSASDPCEDASVVTSRNFAMLLEQAREKCDLLIIAAPPVVMSADALYLGRQADFVLHVVRWNSTPRHVVLGALDRLRNFGIPIDGVILSRIHPRELRRLMGYSQGWKDWTSSGRRMKSAPTVEA
jgi:Mrp family chromosome partitioning ATPase